MRRPDHRAVSLSWGKKDVREVYMIRKTFCDLFAGGLFTLNKVRSVTSYMNGCRMGLL